MLIKLDMRFRQRKGLPGVALQTWAGVELPIATCASDLPMSHAFRKAKYVFLGFGWFRADDLLSRTPEQKEALVQGFGLRVQM